MLELTDDEAIAIVLMMMMMMMMVVVGDPRLPQIKCGHLKVIETVKTNCTRTLVLTTSERLLTSEE
jgi:hypothetical protein